MSAHLTVLRAAGLFRGCTDSTAPTARSMCVSPPRAASGTFCETGSISRSATVAATIKGVVSEVLAEEDVSPVCSPELLQGEHPLLSPGDLRYHRLIHDHFRIDWATWLRAAGLDDINPDSGARFDSAAYAVEAAVQGEGVLLGRSTLVSADLAAGRLVRPFDLALKSRWKYYVVYAVGALRQKKVRMFRDWLISEMTSGLRNRP